MQKVRFCNFDCDLNLDRYRHNNQLYIGLVAADTEHNRTQNAIPGEPVADASVCLPNQHFDAEETALKVYSENEGILEAMLDAGAVTVTGMSTTG